MARVAVVLIVCLFVLQSGSSCWPLAGVGVIMARVAVVLFVCLFVLQSGSS